MENNIDNWLPTNLKEDSNKDKAELKNIEKNLNGAIKVLSKQMKSKIFDERSNDDIDDALGDLHSAIDKIKGVISSGGYK